MVAKTVVFAADRRRYSELAAPSQAMCKLWLSPSASEFIRRKPGLAASVEIAMPTQIGPREAILRLIPLDVDENRYICAEQLLSHDERARADRYVFPDVRRRFVICRAAVRERLAACCDITPAEIRFRYDRLGKPSLEHGLRQPVHFNVSHSGDWALLGIARSALGVDLEILNRSVCFSGLAAQILSPGERPAWDAMTEVEREDVLKRLWVSKEALLKAMGLGIADGLQRVSFGLAELLEVAPWQAEELQPSSVRPADSYSAAAIDPALQMDLEDDGSCRMTHWTDAHSWRLRLLELLPASCAAVCTSRDIDSLLFENSKD